MKLFDALSIRLENYKINYLNLYDYSKGKDLKVFWNADYHLNDYGHQIVAETLFAKYRGIFSGSPPSGRTPVALGYVLLSDWCSSSREARCASHP
jgi:hypothetical protein